MTNRGLSADLCDQSRRAGLTPAGARCLWALRGSVAGPRSRNGRRQNDLVSLQDAFLPCTNQEDVAGRASIMGHQTIDQIQRFQFLSLAKRIRRPGLCRIGPTQTQADDPWSQMFLGSEY
jgi:hypothetical protein